MEEKVHQIQGILHESTKYEDYSMFYRFIELLFRQNFFFAFMANKVPYCERLVWVLHKTRDTEEGRLGDTVKTKRICIFDLFYGRKMKQM